MGVVGSIKLAAWLDPRLAGAGAGGWRPVEARGYKAGEVSRFDADFTPGIMGPNVSADQNLRMVRNRARAMTETGETLEGLRRTIVTKVVGGGGIDFEPDTGIADLDEMLRKAKDRYCSLVDAGRTVPMVERQRMALSEMVTVGDCGVHTPIAPAWNGHPQGPSLELVDEARIPLELNGRTAAGNHVRQGVEFDAIGRAVAYHVLKDHPADGGFLLYSAMIGGVGMDRVDASEFALAHVPRRIGEVRGVPWSMPIMEMVRKERLLTDAILIAYDNLACSAPIIKGWAPPQAGGSPTTGMVDQNGNPFTETAPGRFLFIPAQADVAMPQTVLPAGLDTFQGSMARSYARAMDMPYETVAKDHRGSSFSSARSAKMEERPGVRALQRAVFDAVTRPFWRRVVDWALLRGEVDLSRLSSDERIAVETVPDLLYAVSVLYPGEGWVDPRSEAMADQVALGTAVRTLRDIGGERGFNWEEQLEQRIKEEYRERELRERYGVPKEMPAGGGDAVDPTADPAPPSQNGSRVVLNGRLH